MLTAASIYFLANLCLLAHDWSSGSLARAVAKMDEFAENLWSYHALNTAVICGLVLLIGWPVKIYATLTPEGSAE